MEFGFCKVIINRYGKLVLLKLWMIDVFFFNGGYKEKLINWFIFEYRKWIVG